MNSPTKIQNQKPEPIPALDSFWVVFKSIQSHKDVLRDLGGSGSRFDWYSAARSDKSDGGRSASPFLKLSRWKLLSVLFHLFRWFRVLHFLREVTAPSLPPFLLPTSRSHFSPLSIFDSCCCPCRSCCNVGVGLWKSPVDLNLLGGVAPIG